MLIEIVGTILGLLLFSIFPTVTYLYVEKRSRKHWADVASQRAPGVVRAASWGSLALGQMCLLWLILPAICGGLVYTMSKFNRGGVLTYAVVVGLGVMALLQAFAALGLIPFGIRLLARNSNLRKKARGIALLVAGVNVAALLMAGATYMMLLTPGGIPSIIKVGLFFGVALPVGVYALLSLVLALLIGRSTEKQ